MNISTGKIVRPQKVVVYGPEGIGKSTFAAAFPDPLFIDTEGSTLGMEVRRTDPAPETWEALLQQVQYVADNPTVCKTLAIDTADWAEILCTNYVCRVNGKKGIEDFGYGKGISSYLPEAFTDLLVVLENIVKNGGPNIVLNAHAKMRKFEQPDELGAYDRWEMKLSKHVAPLVKEWADMVLFANYKTVVVNVDDKGAAKGKNKAQGGKRVMYATHHPCWDAKNRHNLPNEMLLDYSNIAHCIPDPATTPPAWTQGPVEEIPERPKGARYSDPRSVDSLPKKEPLNAEPAAEQQTLQGRPAETPTRPDGVPDALWELMVANNVTEKQIQTAVWQKNYYPQNTPIAKYDPAFIGGVLVGAWPQVYKQIKEHGDIPF